MNVLITGSLGYIGTEAVDIFQSAGHTVAGIDSGFYEDCQLYPPASKPYKLYREDIRNARREIFDGIDSVIHLAALSNDPIGELNPELTYEINHRASVKLAKLAKEAGVKRFIMTSTASVYGIATEPVSETSKLNPITAYAKSKLMAEEEISQLASDSFSPVFLRPATAFGAGARLRTDIVLNDFCATVFSTGKIKVMSDGSPRRPAVHVRDIGRTLLACAECPKDLIHNQIFNVGSNEENYSVRELAEMVKAAHGNAQVEFTGEHKDSRSYHVLFDKLHTTLSDYLTFSMTSEKGVAELFHTLKSGNYSESDHTAGKFVRLKQLKRLSAEQQIDENLYFVKG